jgi:hypothetical protein
MVNLAFIHLGNGIRVYNKNDINGIGEYKYIAHIDKRRNVEVHRKDLHAEISLAISYYALTAKPLDDNNELIFDTVSKEVNNLKILSEI